MKTTNLSLLLAHHLSGYPLYQSLKFKNDHYPSRSINGGRPMFKQNKRAQARKLK